MTVHLPTELRVCVAVDCPQTQPEELLVLPLRTALTEALRDAGGTLSMQGRVDWGLAAVDVPARAVTYATIVHVTGMSALSDYADITHALEAAAHAALRERVRAVRVHVERSAATRRLQEQMNVVQGRLRRRKS